MTEMSLNVNTLDVLKELEKLYENAGRQKHLALIDLRVIRSKVVDIYSLARNQDIFIMKQFTGLTGLQLVVLL